MKLFFSRDTTLATLSSHDISVYADTLRCKASIPLHIFPHDEYSARRILYQHLSSVIIKEKNNKPLEVGGQYGDIWRVLEQQIDFRTDYYKSRDDNFGVKLGNGSWTGMMGLVVRGEVHVSSSAFMYNAPRMEAVDYLGPMSTDRMVVYVRKPGSTVLVWNSFLLHFSPGVWMSLTVCLLLLSAASMLLDRTRIHNRKQGTREGLLLEFSRSLFSAITPFCLQGSNLARAEVSWRITHLTMYLAAIIMLASYSASLVSHIMTRTDKLPFNTFEEFLEVGTYTLGVGRHSGHYTHFEISHDPVLRAVYDKHMAPYKSALPSTGLEALNLVCVRPNYAAIELKDALPYYSNKVVCNLQEVPNACVEFKGSMIIQKKSPYLGIFRRTVHDMHRSGILNIINKRNVRKMMEEKQVVFRSVSPTLVTPIFALLATGTLTAILLLKVELIVYRKTLRANK
ncbi:glutamate receptor ionotropic, delta-1 [Cryptotermes secundus]|uniref:glutamate receptor ionotropic, delta-1 n=1 Tax=Cryptotermes secundus TaxID=105785 RepID=UPI001454C743|nr:glutamate receptor ionotropic, delta-1 [Cryptotermes secundus]